MLHNRNNTQTLTSNNTQTSILFEMECFTSLEVMVDLNVNTLKRYGRTRSTTRVLAPQVDGSSEVTVKVYLNSGKKNTSWQKNPVAARFFPKSPKG